MLQKLHEIFDSKYFSTTLILALGLYASLLGPELPEPVKNLFNNTIFRILLLFLVVVRGNKDPRMAIMVAIVFVLTLDYIFAESAKETFVSIKKMGTRIKDLVTSDSKIRIYLVSLSQAGDIAAREIVSSVKNLARILNDINTEEKDVNNKTKKLADLTKDVDRKQQALTNAQKDYNFKLSNVSNYSQKQITKANDDSKQAYAELINAQIQKRTAEINLNYAKNNILTKRTDASQREIDILNKIEQKLTAEGYNTLNFLQSRKDSTGKLKKITEWHLY